ncbi:platelet endothelial aggregation receptor 1 [Biomphalaria pfeifferi]|uniref:Platelet endothelial aggregation receptor 1 n=1 Tax=Biomphalaria pfeifferi TaxID=112525 RepID=A0AAD8BWC0_BIOPF|nr:platelet endothelial aggregation receptor 1 [Biomphalaria pfeifferi]
MRFHSFLSLRLSPFIQIVTAEDESDIFIEFKVTAKRSVTLSPFVLKNFEVMSVKLRAFQGYTIDFCKNSEMRVATLTGTTIEGSKRIGVVSGNCQVMRSYLYCPNKDSSDSLEAEMMPATMYHGQEFITLAINKPHIQGSVIITASKNGTSILVYDHYRFDTVRLTYAGENTVLENLDEPHYVSTNKPVLVVFFFRSDCDNTKVEFVQALTLVVPCELFHDSYSWISPRPIASNYLLLAIRRNHYQHLRLDNTPITSSFVETFVSGIKEWSLYDIFISTGEHSLKSASISFGCYLYGLNTSLAYMHAAGFADIPLETPCEPDLSGMFPGDLRDNDCDHNIDEELLNSIDDDGDDLVDEDLREGPRLTKTPTRFPTTKLVPTSTPTTLQTTTVRSTTTQRKPSTMSLTTPTLDDEVVDYWNLWSEWSCSRVDCTDTRLFQERSCNHSSPKTCVGDAVQYKSGLCYINDTCPKDCPVGTWGLNCINECPNCDPDCDKFNGTCKLCQPGFQYPNTSCSSECSPMRYGFNCREDCYIKCKTDCKERVNGICPVGLSQYLPLVFLIPVIPLTVLFLLGKKMSTSENESSLEGLNMEMVPVLEMYKLSSILRQCGRRLSSQKYIVQSWVPLSDGRSSTALSIRAVAHQLGSAEF